MDSLYRLLVSGGKSDKGNSPAAPASKRSSNDAGPGSLKRTLQKMLTLDKTERAQMEVEDDHKEKAAKGL